MFEGPVLGVDPGLARTGLAVLEVLDRKPVITWSDTVFTPAGTPEAGRLRTIAAALRTAIEVHRPVAVAVERVMFGVNKGSALSVARATGVVMLVAAEAGLEVEEYVPLEVKSAVTGQGSADKRQVHTALIRVHGLADVPSQPDAADAVAVALCHLTQARLRMVATEAGDPMIAFLEGEVVEKAAGRVVLAVGGTGYDVLVPSSVLSSLPPVGRTARVHTRLVVREDAMVLYGFGSTDERALFDSLMGVTGVGPKVALAFLSTLAPPALRRAVVDGDLAALTAVPGVGKKVAQRVVLDLRDRLGGEGELIEATGPLAEAREALRALGLSPQEAADALAGLEADGRATEDLLREALQGVGRG